GSLQVQPQVFKIKGRKRRNVALVAEDFRDGRGVVNGSEGCVHDGIAFTHLEHGSSVLRGAQGNVLQGADVRLIEIHVDGSSSASTKPKQRSTTAEGGERGR